MNRPIEPTLTPPCPQLLCADVDNGGRSGVLSRRVRPRNPGQVIADTTVKSIETVGSNRYRVREGISARPLSDGDERRHHRVRRSSASSTPPCPPFDRVIVPTVFAVRPRHQPHRVRRSTGSSTPPCPPLPVRLRGPSLPHNGRSSCLTHSSNKSLTWTPGCPQYSPSKSSLRPELEEITNIPI